MATSYVNNLNGETYNLPTTFSGSFRENYYLGATSTDPTRSNARIRALVYIWMENAGFTPSSSGPFVDSLTSEQKTNMLGGSATNTIALFSDAGYAPDISGGDTCEDDAGATNPWDFITDAFGSQITTYYTPSKEITTNLPSADTLDLWQASSAQLSAAASDIVICSDIIQLCAPTQYDNNNDETFPNYSVAYVNIQTVFDNLFSLVKSGGYLFLTVPYDGDPTATTGSATEVIPNSETTIGCNLWNWNYAAVASETVIQNEPNGSSTTTDHDINFTGGINCPGILRTFTRGAVYNYLDTAGFTNISFHNINTTMNSLGIYWDANIDGSGNWTGNNSSSEGDLASKSLVVTAQKA